MKKIVSGMLTLVLTMAVFTACGSNKKSDFKITSEPPSSYPGYSVKIVVENEQEMESVHLEYPKGTMTPMDRVDIPVWEINFMLPQDATGKINLGIIGKPKDGSPAITQSFEYEIMENPTINAKVVSENFDGAELEVKTSKPFKKVYIQTDDNKQINFERKSGNTYNLKTKELDFDNKGYAVNLEDESGNILNANIEYTKTYVSDGMPKIFKISGSKQMNDYQIIYFHELDDNQQLRKSYEYKIKNRKDGNIDDVPKESLSSENFYCNLLSISPTRKFMLFVGTRIVTLKEKLIDSTGQILKSVDANYTILFDLETGKYEFIGEPYYYKEYKNPRSALVFKEEGPLFYFMRWEGDNLYLLEQRKDPRMMYDEGEGSNVQDGQSTLATARIVSYSITKKTITVTSQKPVTPWLTFSDQWTGIQGWSNPSIKENWINSPLLMPRTNIINSIVLFSVPGKNGVFDIRNYIKDNNPKKFVLVSSKPLYVGMDSQKPFVIIEAHYQESFSEDRDRIETRGETPFDSYSDIYKLCLLTDKFEKVCTFINQKSKKDQSQYKDFLENDCLKDYCKYFTIKDGKIISKYKCDKYINPIESIRYIN